jgi:hypothetical protein
LVFNQALVCSSGAIRVGVARYVLFIEEFYRTDAGGSSGDEHRIVILLDTVIQESKGFYWDFGGLSRSCEYPYLMKKSLLFNPLSPSPLPGGEGVCRNDGLGHIADIFPL